MNINYCLNKADYNVNFNSDLKKFMFIEANTYKHCLHKCIFANRKKFMEKKNQFKKNFLFICHESHNNVSSNILNEPKAQIGISQLCQRQINENHLALNVFVIKNTCFISERYMYKA